MRNFKIGNIILVIFLICFYHISFGQKASKNITITGYVLDAKQNPVQNAAIFIDKIKTNSVTDKNGFYKIKTSRKSQEIMVFSILGGYVKDTINGRTSINFTLSGDSKASDNKNISKDNNETINTGYGTAKKSDLTDNINKVNGQEQRFAAYQDIYDMLRGAVPGVEVNGKEIKIRGTTSLNVSTEPLFVVDGVIVKSIDDISPQYVKSIEVLKGPAASVYGTRGSNGVILITLISGKDRK